MRFGSEQQIWKTDRSVTPEHLVPHLQPDFPPTANPSVQSFSLLKQLVSCLRFYPPQSAAKSNFLFCVYFVSLCIFVVVVGKRSSVDLAVSRNLTL